MQLSSEFVAQTWPLEQVDLGSTLQRYPTRQALTLQAHQGRFVLKVFDNEEALGLVSPSPTQIDQGLYVFDYLAARSFPHIPRLLKTRSGQTFFRDAVNTAYMLEWIEGTRPILSVATWSELGRIAAHLNGYRDYPFSYPISIDGTIVELTEMAEVYAFKEEFLQQVAKLAALQQEATSLIHAEINEANTVQTPDGRLYLLDWDSVGTGPTVLEAGYPLITCFLTEDLIFHADWAAAYYDAYTGGAGMTEEVKQRVFIAALLHALRYLRYAPTRRWARIRYALIHQDRLLSVIHSA